MYFKISITQIIIINTTLSAAQFQTHSNLHTVKNQIHVHVTEKHLTKLLQLNYHTSGRGILTSEGIMVSSTNSVTYHLK